MLNITLIASDLQALSHIRTKLEGANAEVRGYTNNASVLSALRNNKTDVVAVLLQPSEILESEWYSKVKSGSQAPVVMIGDGDDELQEVIALRMGADDFVSETASSRILFERLRHAATMSREHRLPETVEPAGRTEVRGDLEISFSDWLVRWRGKAVSLTARELRVLYALARIPGHVKSREQIMDEAYGHEPFADDRTVDSHIKRIRQKLRTVDPNFDCIEAVYGVGYKYHQEDACHPSITHGSSLNDTTHQRRLV
ncbi:two-component system response regulator ChvI [Rhodovulum adriaticum]|uniref:Two-component system response regulator ChvI n=2 Tax=Rhodovulum adriaticum TaxID=35804 RepID=A0A4R2NLK2_RHOAD|nr:two-component system response regulator ChvI [Rhodovulum adriaticum]